MFRTQVEIDSKNPFANCKLGREVYANSLTSLIESNNEGFVLSIDNEWGTGKTTFIKMWQAKLELNGYTTVYLNAWENDYENDPLISIIGELKQITHSGIDTTFETLVSKGSILTKSIVPTIIKGIAGKFVGNETVKEVINALAEGTGDLLKQQVDDYFNRKKELKEFRTSLSKFVKKSTNKKPLIFFIDELDRCKPNFAVELLERIKHLFTINEIVFILSIDKSQLIHAIRGFYGSENINANEYLRRFIDIEYSMPEPDPILYIKHLIDLFDINKFFRSSNRFAYNHLKNEISNFNSILENLISDTNLSLRQLEKLFIHFKLVINSTEDSEYLFPEIILVLIYLRIFYPENYNNIVNKKLSFDEISKFLKDDVFKTIHDDNIRLATFIEARLLHFYKNYCNENLKNKSQKRLLEFTTNKVLTKSAFASEENDNGFSVAIIDLDRSHMFDNFNLGELLNKINLVKPQMRLFFPNTE